MKEIATTTTGTRSSAAALFVLIVLLFHSSFPTEAASGSLISRPCGHSQMKHLLPVPKYSAWHQNNEGDLNVEESIGEGAGGRGGRRRHVERLSAVSSWNTIKIHLNFTLLTNPEKDVLPSSGEVLACLRDGQKVPHNISGPCEGLGGSSGRDCLSTCFENDIVTGEVKKIVQSTLEEVRDYFQKLLEVEQEDASSGAVHAAFPCGGVETGNMTIDQDVSVIVTARPTQGSTLAYAGVCEMHPRTARPVLIHLNVAPRTTSSSDDLVTVLRHELTHGLGFSHAMFKYFRHPSDRTKTYREYAPHTFGTGPVVARTGLVETPEGFDYDHSKMIVGDTLKLITPTVLAYGRYYFGCPSLAGVNLETVGGAASAGSHWETKILSPEFMTARQKAATGVVSGFSLALFNDMGFYKVDMGEAEAMSWGYKLGCDFVDAKCSRETWPYFCEEQRGPACTYDDKQPAICNLQKYNVDLPKPFQYFDDPTLGGSDVEADYCPFGRPVVAGNDCRYEEGLYSSSVNNPPPRQAGFLGNLSGSSSRCMKSTIGVQSPAVSCYQLTCDPATPQSARVRVGESYYPCEAGQSVQLIRAPRLRAKYNLGETRKETPNYYYTHETYVVGVVTCPSSLQRLCNATQRNMLQNEDITFMSDPEWPVILAVGPEKGNLEDKVFLTVSGRNFVNCSRLRIGGLYSSNFTLLNETHLTANAPKIPSDSIYGGEEERGSGLVDVELWCDGPMCPGGCIVARLVNGFNYTLPEEVPFDALSAFQDFLNSTTGKIVGAVIGLMVVTLFLCILRSCLSSPSKHAVIKKNGGGRRVHSRDASTLAQMEEELMMRGSRNSHQHRGSRYASGRDLDLL